MADYAAELKRILSAEGCYFLRQGKGSHEIWYSPKLDKRFVVVSKIKGRNLANKILKQAGVEKAF